MTDPMLDGIPQSNDLKVVSDIAHPCFSTILKKVSPDPNGNQRFRIELYGSEMD